jgi:hypothetical protein
MAAIPLILNHMSVANGGPEELTPSAESSLSNPPGE